MNVLLQKLQMKCGFGIKGMNFKSLNMLHAEGMVYVKGVVQQNRQGKLSSMTYLSDQSKK
jgi:hypothetical protein